jgi:hypothetical protein
VHISVTPNGNRHFLGEFGNQIVSLTVPNMPPHKEITIAFDLFIIRTWDGNHLIDGPDIWSMSVDDLPPLLTTTFENFYDTVDPRLPIQSYPGDYPTYNPIRTGADENNTLGYTYVSDKKTWNMDAVYKLRFTFQHSANAVRFKFAGSGLSELTDESWGITNFKVAVGVEPLPTVSASKAAAAIKSARAPGALALHTAATRPTRSRTSKRLRRAPKKTVKSSGTPLHPRKKPLTP